MRSPLLQPIEAKLSRAGALLTDLKSQLHTFLQSEPIVIRCEFADDRRTLDVKSYKVKETPIIYSVIAGEIVHHARSSLDYLIAALALSRNNEVLDSHQFPICSTAQAFDLAIKRNCCRGIGEEAIKLIQQTQAFQPI